MTFNLSNAVIAITGAGSGIGKALAIECAKHGARLAISDVNSTSLDELEAKLSVDYPAILVQKQTLDVADKIAMDQWAKSIENHFGKINIIINNAGVALSATVESMKMEDFEWLMRINFWGVINGTKSFLPIIKQSKWGHIVNISSLFGLISTPNSSAYNAAKFAVRGFTESLRIELMLSDKHINVSCVHPGGIKTNIANASRDGGECVGLAARMSEQEKKQNFNDKMAKTTAEQAAKIIIKGIIKKRPRILIGNDAKLLDWIQRFMPVKYHHIVAYVFR